MSKGVPVAYVVPAGEFTPLTGGNATIVLSSGSVAGDPNAPRGAWRDSLCDCCILGPCHPSLWCACCCPQLLMAQVLTRMNMSWLAVKNSPETPRTFRNVIGVVILYWVASSILAPDEPEVIVSGDALNPDIEVIPQHINPTQYLLYKIVNWAFALYTLIVMMKLYVPLLGVNVLLLYPFSSFRRISFHHSLAHRFSHVFSLFSDVELSGNVTPFLIRPVFPAPWKTVAVPSFVDVAPCHNLPDTPPIIMTVTLLVVPIPAYNLDRNLNCKLLS
jgi:hypothetical protein